MCILGALTALEAELGSSGGAAFGAAGGAIHTLVGREVDALAVVARDLEGGGVYSAVHRFLVENELFSTLRALWLQHSLFLEALLAALCARDAVQESLGISALGLGGQTSYGCGCAHSFF